LTFAGNSWWVKAEKEGDPRIRRSARILCRSHDISRRGLIEGLEEKLLCQKLPVDSAGEKYAALQTALAMASMETRGRFARALSPAGLRVHGDKEWKRMAPSIDVKPFVDYKKSLPAPPNRCPQR
jgi:hypothetical protein